MIICIINIILCAVESILKWSEEWGDCCFIWVVTKENGKMYKCVLNTLYFCTLNAIKKCVNYCNKYATLDKGS